MSSEQVIIWGEPLGAAAFVPRLASSFSTISDTWPPQSFFPNSSDLKILKNHWIANLTPEIHYLCEANRQFFLEWLKKPAIKKFGIERWGFKEVRLSAEHAKFLKMLFPDARFVYIYRNPIDAFRSWKGNKWADFWPGYCTYSALVFANHWKTLLSGFIDCCEETDGILIKFEDLVSGKFNLTRLTSHLMLDYVDSSVLKKKIGTTQLDKIKKKNLLFIDKWIITVVAGKLMKKVGYL